MSRLDRVYLLITIFLALAAIAGGVTLTIQRRQIEPTEIILSEAQAPELNAQVYITGAVASPGMYPIVEGDTLQTVLSSAGIESDADLNHIKIYVPHEGEEQSPQKIDINRAEPWLLEALPGIGEVLAQRIVDYRSEHGSFRTIEDLLKVSGIGSATFAKIKDYIAVSD